MQRDTACCVQAKRECFAIFQNRDVSRTSPATGSRSAALVFEELPGWNPNMPARIFVGND